MALCQGSPGSGEPWHGKTEERIGRTQYPEAFAQARSTETEIATRKLVYATI